MPLFVDAYEQSHAEGLTVFAINVGESAAAAQDFVDGYDIRFPVGLDTDQSVTQNYRVFGLPTTFFINRQGVIDYVVVGALREPDLRRLVGVVLQDGVDAP